MAFEHIKVGITRHVGWLEFNRPPINAFTWDMIEEVLGGLAALMSDPDARVIVLAGGLEKYFSAGAELQSFDGISTDGMAAQTDLVHSVALRLRESSKPLLAAIHGLAVGGGLEMTLHCDLRFAAEDARLGQPEINLGFIPPVATTQALVRLLGRSRAIRFLYDGGRVTAPEALSMGLVDFIHPPEVLRAEVQTYAETLAQKPPEALEAIRKTITEGMDLPFGEGMALEKAWVVRLSETRNFKEGIRAFLDKRKPDWEWD